MKLNNLLSIILTGLIVCVLGSCDTIKEGDRLIYVQPKEDPKEEPEEKPGEEQEITKCNILIEDFTGQRCVNCPTATGVIESLQEKYSDSVVIAVAIPSGPFGHRTTMSSARLPLCTEIGDEYYTHWGIEYQPGVKINRGAPIYSSAQYAAVVREALEQVTPVKMSLSTEYHADTKIVDITVDAFTSEDVNGKLQVWVTENNIVGAQMMPDGSQNMEYVHQHVFRTSVTSDIFGDNFSVEEGATKSASYTVTLDEEWDPNNIVIVAFVSNTTDGVLQVVKANIVDIINE